MNGLGVEDIGKQVFEHVLGLGLASKLVSRKVCGSVQVKRK